jgi:hypothetical protein
MGRLSMGQTRRSKRRRHGSHSTACPHYSRTLGARSMHMMHSRSRAGGGGGAGGDPVRPGGEA